MVFANLYEYMRGKINYARLFPKKPNSVYFKARSALRTK